MSHSGGVAPSRALVRWVVDVATTSICHATGAVILGGETVADSTAIWLLHPPDKTPTYLFPREHVRAELFGPGDQRETDPAMGSPTYWTVRVGDREAPDAAYSYEQPPEAAAEVAGLVAFDWDSMDGVFEEDEEVFVHPCDPFARIDVLRSSRHVRVRLGGTVVADSTRPRMLLESGLPVRCYLPREDVRTDLLEPSYTTTRCPYKGIAHYWSLWEGVGTSSRTSPGPTRNPSTMPKRCAG